MNMLKIISNLFNKPLPLWSYGLECKICKRTFTSEQNHYDYVKGRIAEKFHEGKIPILKGDNYGKKRKVRQCKKV